MATCLVGPTGYREGLLTGGEHLPEGGWPPVGGRRTWLRGGPACLGGSTWLRRGGCLSGSGSNSLRRRGCQSRGAPVGGENRLCGGSTWLTWGAAVCARAPVGGGAAFPLLSPPCEIRPPPPPPGQWQPLKAVGTARLPPQASTASPASAPSHSALPAGSLSPPSAHDPRGPQRTFWNPGLERPEVVGTAHSGLWKHNGSR